MDSYNVGSESASSSVDHGTTMSQKEDNLDNFNCKEVPFCGNSNGSSQQASPLTEAFADLQDVLPDDALISNEYDEKQTLVSSKSKGTTSMATENMENETDDGNSSPEEMMFGDIDNSDDLNASNNSSDEDITQLLQNYLIDSENFLRLRAILSTEVERFYKEKGHQISNIEVFKDVVHKLLYGGHDSVYAMLGKSFLVYTEHTEIQEAPTEKPTIKMKYAVEEHAGFPLLAENLQAHLLMSSQSSDANNADPGPVASGFAINTGCGNDNPTVPIVDCDDDDHDEHEAKLENIYEKLKPVIDLARSALSIKKLTPKKIITTFGKPAFCALFNSAERVHGSSSGRGGKTKFDQDKVGSIARFVSWLISSPKKFSLTELKTYSYALMEKQTYGLEPYELYFELNVIQKFACTERKKPTK